MKLGDHRRVDVLLGTPPFFFVGVRVCFFSCVVPLVFFSSDLCGARGIIAFPNARTLKLRQTTTGGLGGDVSPPRLMDIECLVIARAQRHTQVTPHETNSLAHLCNVQSAHHAELDDKSAMRLNTFDVLGVPMAAICESSTLCTGTVQCCRGCSCIFFFDWPGLNCPPKPISALRSVQYLW